MSDSPKRTTAAPRLRTAVLTAASLLCTALGGCAALTNPVGDGIPVRHLAPELLGKSKEGEKTIPLSLLGQAPPDTYRLAAGDTLGVWIEGVLGDKALPMPVSIASPVLIREQRRLPPAAGYPIPVRDDGTVVLPALDPLPVQGLSLAQAEDAVRAAYTKKMILQAGKERVQVTLLQGRQYHVVVVRQEANGTSIPVADATAATGKRGSGHVIDLPAYENDVLHALVQTGGLPGLDAYDEVVVQRAAGPLMPGGGPAPGPYLPQCGAGGQVIHIPLRAPCGAAPPVRPQDVVLHNGDVIFLEARDTEVFYTAGLLPSGQYILPRDYDLTVVDAISRIKGPMVNGAFGANTLAGNLINPGIGNPSPSLLSVLRRTPGGGQVVIRISLNRALRDPRENILVQPGDMLVLQEQPSEALARYFTQVLFNFTGTWQAFHNRFFTGVVDVNAVQNVPARIGVVNNLVSP